MDAETPIAWQTRMNAANSRSSGAAHVWTKIRLSRYGVCSHLIPRQDGVFSPRASCPKALRAFLRDHPELLLKGWKEVASRSAIATESLLMNFSLYRKEISCAICGFEIELWKIWQDLYTYYPIYFWKILGYISVCPSIYFEQEKTLKFARKNFTFSS